MTFLRRRGIGIIAAAAILSLALSACSKPADQGQSAGGSATAQGQPQQNAAPQAPRLSGDIVIDGSSTVAPISEAVAEEFMKLHPGVRVTVGVSGSSGGFKKFVKGEIDIADASRPIKESEREAAAGLGIQAIELPVAYDGLSVLVNPANDFAACMTVEELKRIWEPGSQITHWNQVRPEWPAEPIKLYGPGTDSGTFEYFTEAIVGEAKKSRPDYVASEDDNTLVQGIAGDRYALGYFGYAYYAENTDKLKLVAIDGGDGCVAPSEQTINDGTYKPLSRPIFIYPSSKSLERPEVKEFVKFYLTEGRPLVSEVGYVQLPASMYEEGLAKVGQ